MGFLRNSAAAISRSRSYLNAPRSGDRGRKLTLVVVGLCLAMALASDASAAARAQASSGDGAFVVFADSSTEADLVKLEAERDLLRFNQMFGLVNSKKASPIVLVVGAADNDPIQDRGTIRVYRKGSWMKIQINWDETPIPRDAFLRTWIRALCVRRAIDQMDESERQEGDLRMPVWVAEGVAALLAEPSIGEEILGRASLLARTEPSLTLDGALSEFEGQSDLGRNAWAIAGTVCRALTQDPSGRSRFLASLNWNVKMTAREWIARVGGVEDLNQWWQDVWKRQSLQLSWVKLGYGFTLRDFEQRQSVSEETTEETDAPETSRGIDAVSHPWFRELFRKKARRARDARASDPSEICRNIDFRRGAALEWYSGLQAEQPSLSKEELLEWFCLQEDVSPSSQAGPVTKWFNTIVPPRAKKTAGKS
jgi:hypothetical protein